VSISIYPPILLNKGAGQPTDFTTVGDTSTEIVPENLSRVFVTLFNKDKDDVWVACDETAILGEGEFLSRNGGSMLIDSTAFTSGPINGICASGKTADVTFQEFHKA